MRSEASVTARRPFQANLVLHAAGAASGLSSTNLTMKSTNSCLSVEFSSLRAALTRTLQQLREILHRRGRLSSRAQALDEISRLFFAHVVTALHGGTGISGASVLRAAGDEQRPAEALGRFVERAFRAHLPTSLAHEMDATDFRLAIRPTEHALARELIDCFERSLPLSDVAALPYGFDLLNEVFGSFIADAFADEKELGQYLTPPEVVGFMVDLAIEALSSAELDALLSPTEAGRFGLILDPSCGVGSFLVQLARRLHPTVVEPHGLEAARRWLRTMLDEVLVGIDKSERMVRLALTNSAMFGWPAARLHLANALDRTGGDAPLADALAGRARLILTNPPFGAEYAGQDLAGFKIATAWATRPPRKVDSELLFVERYLDWLDEGGQLVAVVPDSILTNKGLYRDLRTGVGAKAELLAVVSLPPVTFGAAGTGTKTSVVHLRKAGRGERTGTLTYVACCEQIGYTVATRGAQRSKIAHGESDLPGILDEIRAGPEGSGGGRALHGRWVRDADRAARWDAGYHAGLPAEVEATIERLAGGGLTVRQVADLATERVDPRRWTRETFDYVEIADVDGATCAVQSRPVRCREAPSRARKLVRAGDVLVSTVRPERRIVGVVGEEQDGAVCTTGFAVLRPRAIDPFVLAHLLKTDFVTAQIVRNTLGIAYPAVEEGCLLDLVLPVGAGDLGELAEYGARLAALQHESMAVRHALTREIERAAARRSGATMLPTPQAGAESAPTGPARDDGIA